MLSLLVPGLRGPEAALLANTLRIHCWEAGVVGDKAGLLMPRLKFRAGPWLLGLL